MSFDTHVLHIGSDTTVRYFNDRSPLDTSDAWKYKIDHDMWSAPFGSFDSMLESLLHVTVLIARDRR